MNYTFNGLDYIADTGYMFRNKKNGMTGIILRLSVNSSFDEWECVEIPEETEVNEDERDSLHDT